LFLLKFDIKPRKNEVKEAGEEKTETQKIDLKEKDEVEMEGQHSGVFCTVD